jgi:hypothetical protein
VDKGNDMGADITPGGLRVFVIISLVFAILGAAFYWWVPMGLVMSLAGMLFGFIDWTAARRRSLNSRLSVLAMLLSLAAFSLDTVIAYLGLQTVTFGQ